MSKFYLTMNGGKSNSQTVTRRGMGGGSVIAARWEGCVKTSYYARADGKPMVRVIRQSWRNSGGPSVVLYDGPFDMSDPNYKTDLSERAISPEQAIKQIATVRTVLLKAGL